MRIHLVIIQPAGYIHSLGFLDSARYLRHQFRRLGYETTIAKNRPLHGALNIVFGAHIEFPESWAHDYTCVIFNQEQLGAGGANLSPEYMQLLRRSHVLDYDIANMPAYGDGGGRSGLLRAVAPLLNAPYLLDTQGALALEERPIDLLFIGSINQARRQTILRLEACGLSVSHFDHPMYGPERDQYIAQAKAVLNIPFYASTRFEQTRVFNSLSIGTPVVSLRRPDLIVDSAFESAVHWFEEAALEQYFTHQFKSESWFLLSQEQLRNWRENDGYEAYQALSHQLEHLAQSAPAWSGQAGLKRGESTDPGPPPQVIRRLNLSPERGYRPDWVNAGSNGLDASVDVRLDLDSLAPTSEKILVSESGVRHVLRPDELSEAYLYCQQGRLPSLRLLTALTNYLEVQGSLVLDVPLGVFSETDQRSTLAAVLVEAKLRLLHEEYLRSSKQEAALELQRFEQMEEHTSICGGKLLFARLTFSKRQWTPRERVIARMMRDDFGGLPEDLVSPADS